MPEYFQAWEYTLAIGLVVLIAGIVMVALKGRGGLLLTFVGLCWLITFGIYFALMHVGLYGKIGAGPGLVLNAIGLAIMLAGIASLSALIRRMRRRLG